MKKVFSSFLVLLFLLNFLSPAFATQDDISVVINGQSQIYDVPPLVENGRTLVPMRAVFESLGAIVQWEQSTKTVTGIKGDIKVTLQLGSKNANVSGKNVTLDVPADTINNRTMVPLRFISESMGADVFWNQNTRTVIITSTETNDDDKVIVEDENTNNDNNQESDFTFLELNTPYVSDDNDMTVTVKSIELVKKGEFNTYEITYLEQNLTEDKVIDQGSFKIFYNDDKSTPQYGFFNKLYPNEEAERKYTFQSEVIGQEAILIEYGTDLFFNKKPSNNTLKWEVTH